MPIWKGGEIQRGMDLSWTYCCEVVISKDVCIRMFICTCIIYVCVQMHVYTHVCVCMCIHMHTCLSSTTEGVKKQRKPRSKEHT